MIKFLVFREYMVFIKAAQDLGGFFCVLCDKM